MSQRHLYSSRLRRRRHALWALVIVGTLWGCDDDSETGDPANDAEPGRDMRVEPDMGTLPMPDMDVPTPDMEAPEADMEVPTPDMDVPAPDMEVPTPDMEVPMPDMEIPMPDMEVPTPDMEVGGCEGPQDCAPEEACVDEVCVPGEPRPGAGDMVITEILYDPHDPLDDEGAEWFEVHNTTDQALRLDGCTIVDSTPENAQIIDRLVIPAGGYGLFVSSDDAAANGGLTPDYVFEFGLNNGGDSVTITCGDDVIDTVTYDDEAPWPIDARRQAIKVPADQQGANDQGASWCYADAPYYAPEGDPEGVHRGTPGAANPDCAPPDLTIDQCRLQRPLESVSDAGTELLVSGRVLEAGVTDRSPGVDAFPGLRAEVGFGPDGSAPEANDAWTWSAAAPFPLWNGEAAGEPTWDEYQGAFQVPGAGEYDFAFRFTKDDGLTWLYCDRNAGAGSDGSEDGYQADNAGQLTSLDSPCDNFVCDTPAPPACGFDNVTLITQQPEGLCEVQNNEPTCTYPTVETDCSLDGGICRAGSCVGGAPQAGPGQIAITEIMYDPHDPLSDGDAEWFEVRNTTDQRLTLHNCALVDGTPDNLEIIQGVVLEPFAYALFVASDDQALNGGLAADATFGFGLNNTGDTITITCGDDVVDSVEYDDAAPWPLDAQRQSISLDGPVAGAAGAAGDNDNAARWCYGEGAYFSPADPAGNHQGTPGAPNPACPIIDPCDPNPCLEPPVAICDGDTAVTYDAPGACENVEGEAQCLYAEIRTPCEGGEICQAGACVPPEVQPPAEGQIVITEIMYDPHDPLGDGDAEWFEVHNATDEPLNLATCSASVNAGSVDVGNRILEPRGYLLFVKSGDGALNGGLVPDVVFDFAVGNSGATVTFTCGDTVIDSVQYDDGAPWPVDARRHSISLDPGALTAAGNDDGANWCFGRGVYFDDEASSGQDHLGTPGGPNPACDDAVDFCRLQFPQDETIEAGEAITAYGRVYEVALTDRSPGVDTTQLIRGQVGYGPDGSGPVDNDAWAWIEAEPNPGWDGANAGEADNDEYQAGLAALDLGTYDLAFRFTADGGRTWTYCDGRPEGSSNGYSVDDAGSLTVAAPVLPCDPNPCVDPPAPDCVDPLTARTFAPVGQCAEEDGEPVCTYDEQLEQCDPVLEQCAAGACVPLAGRAPAAGELRLTEIMYNPNEPLDDETSEWIEVHNTTDEIIDLAGCALADSEGAEDIGDLRLAPGAYSIFARNDDADLNGGLDPVYVFAFELGNNDTITLTCGETIIFSVTYTNAEPWPVDAQSRSISLGAEAPNADPTSWCLALDDDRYFDDGAGNFHYGTPGAANPACPVPPNAVDFCRLQFPTDAQVEVGEAVTFYGRLYEEGFTDISALNDPDPLIIGQLGYGPDGSDPSVDDAGWTWADAEPNPGWSGANAGEVNNDEYQYSLTVDARGTYDTAFRFTVDGGVSWTHCDGDDPGNTNGYSVDQAGHLQVGEPLEPFADDEVEALYTASCGGCHTNGGRSGGLNLDEPLVSTVNIPSSDVPVMDLIEPGDPESSYIYHKLRGTHRDVGGAGSRMPLGGPFFTEDEIERFALWIRQLAP